MMMKSFLLLFIQLLSWTLIKSDAQLQYKVAKCSPKDPQTKEFGCTNLKCIDGFWKIQNDGNPRDCKLCECHGDPYCNSFDMSSVDVQTICEYTMTQLLPIVPQYPATPRGPSVLHGIYAKFGPCSRFVDRSLPSMTCVDKTTFEDKLPWNLKIEVFHRNLPALGFKVHPFALQTITDIPLFDTLYDVGGTYIYKTLISFVPMFVILGNDEYKLEATERTFNIWAKTSLYDDVGGLCGLFDGNPLNDYTDSDTGTVIALNPFAKSWLTFFPYNVLPQCRNPRDFNPCLDDEEIIAQCTSIASEEGLADDSQGIADCVKDLCERDRLVEEKEKEMEKEIEEIKNEFMAIEIEVAKIRAANMNSPGKM